MIRRPPRSTLFPYRRSSDLEKQPVKLVIKKDKTLFSNQTESLSETNQSAVQKTKKNSSTEQKKKGKEESPCKSPSPAVSIIVAKFFHFKSQKERLPFKNYL